MSKIEEIENTGEIIAFTRVNKDRNTILQLGVVNNFNNTDDEENLLSVEVLPITKKADAPNVNQQTFDITEPDILRKTGFEEPMTVHGIGITLEVSKEIEIVRLGAFDEETAEKIYAFADEAEATKSRLFGLPPERLKGTGFPRIDQKTIDTLSSKLASSRTKQFNTTTPQKTAPPAEKPAKAEKDTSTTIQRGLSPTTGKFTANRPNGHYPEDSWDIG